MKVNETRRRSLLKALSWRILEIAFTSLVLSFFVQPQVAIGLAVGLELLCATLHYCFERIWNLSNYGREIK